MESILTSVKKMLGIPEDYEYFDQDLIMHINSVFLILQQLGVGPPTGYSIKDKNNNWSEFTSYHVMNVEAVKSYMNMKVKLMFDVNGMTSYVITAYEERCKELEWRLNVQVDPGEKVNISKEDILNILYREAVLRGYSGTKEEWLILITGTGAGGAPILQNDLIARIAAGGIKVGDQFFQGEQLETLWRKLLDPVQGPTLSNPSVLIIPSGGLVMESGSTKDVTLIIKFDRGSISPAYGTSGYRSGDVTEYQLNGVVVSDINNSVTVSETNKEFTAMVSYAEGEQPKNSAGDDFDSPLPAGSVSSPKLEFEFVDALWSNAGDITVIAKEDIISKRTKTKTFVFPPQTVTHPEVFDVPKSWNVTNIEAFNEMTNRFETINDFVKSDTIHQDAAGRDVDYIRYQDRRGYKADTRQVRITWE